MTNQQVQRKLNQMAKLSRELHEEAQRRWSKEDGAGLFFEPESGFYMMAHDSCDFKRREGIRFHSNVMHGGDAGAW